MLKVFTTLDEVPEPLREHYKLIEGKYVPEVSDDHPVKVNNVKLLNEKNAAETKASGLESANTSLKADLESAKGSSVPRGHVVVTKAEAEAYATLKEQGTAAEIATKLTEHKSLKEEVASRVRQDSLRAVAKELDYNPEAFALLPGLPEFKVNDKDGKKTVVALVKGESDVITEKPAKEFIEGSENLAPLLPALKATSGTFVPGQTRDSGKPAGNLYDSIRKNVKDSEEAATKTNTLPLGQRRGITEIGGTVQA